MERQISVGIFRPKYVDHLQKWSRIFRSEETETDLSIWIPTEISGIFGIMESTLWKRAINAIKKDMPTYLCDTRIKSCMSNIMQCCFYRSIKESSKTVFYMIQLQLQWWCIDNPHHTNPLKIFWLTFFSLLKFCFFFNYHYGYCLKCFHSAKRIHLSNKNTLWYSMFGSQSHWKFQCIPSSETQGLPAGTMRYFRASDIFGRKFISWAVGLSSS